MSRLVLASILMIVTACMKRDSPPVGGGAASVTKSQAATPEVKPAVDGGFKLGDATVIQLLDKRFRPVSTPMWKLHADGTTEGLKGMWPELQAKPDGTIWVQGQQLATVTPTAIIYTIPDGPKPIAIDGDTLSLVVWEKAHDGEDYTAKIELAADGAITVHHRDGTRLYWKIEAADLAVMRTAFHVFALSMKAELD